MLCTASPNNVTLPVGHGPCGTELRNTNRFSASFGVISIARRQRFARFALGGGARSDQRRACHASHDEWPRSPSPSNCLGHTDVRITRTLEQFCVRLGNMCGWHTARAVEHARRVIRHTEGLGDQVVGSAAVGCIPNLRCAAWARVRRAQETHNTRPRLRSAETEYSLALWLGRLRLAWALRVVLAQRGGTGCSRA